MALRVDGRDGGGAGPPMAGSVLPAFACSKNYGHRPAAKASEGQIMTDTSPFDRLRRSAGALSGWQLLLGRGSLSAVAHVPNPYRGFRYPAEVIQHAV